MLKLNSKNKLFITISVWIFAIAIRLYGATTPSQHYDIGTFEAWSRLFWVHGPKLFFSNVWSDYLPLPILTFAPISVVADLFQANFGLTFKLVHIFIELILIFFIVKLNPRYLLASSIYLLLSPALIGDNSFWGQVDTIPSLLALLSISTLLSPSSSLLAPGILFGLAVAYKPIMILVAPVLWIVDIKNGHKFRFPLISSLVFLATGIPTGGLNFFRHLLDRALSQSGTYPFLTVNAFNLWSLFPVNSWIQDSTSVLGISGQLLGLSLFSVLTLITLNNWRRHNFDKQYALKIAGTILVLFYVFTTRMHERHLLFGLPFLALAAVYDTWLLIPFTLLTLCFTLNLYGAFYWVNHAQVWPFSVSFISLISWITTITSFLLAMVWSWPQLLKSGIYHLKSNKILFGILVFGILLRFLSLSHPPAYIFDEVYHSFTAREYIHNHIEAWEWWTTPPQGVAYEWTHPPFAKYGMVVGMLLFGENSFGWRVGSATFGVISIFGIYLLVSTIFKNKNLALIAAFLVSIEGLHIAQSRIGMNDTYMLCFYIWSLYLAVKSRWKGAAVLYGLSLASKWSALYGVIPLAFIYLNQNNPLHWSLKSGVWHLFHAVRLCIVAILVYILTFAPFILAGHTWAQWWELHRQMWYYHTHLVATHGYQSVPPQWLFALRPVWYWVEYGKDVISNIYAQSNPLILWLGLVAIVLQIKKLLDIRYSLFFILYLVFTLPWIFSPRIMFFYHYLPSSVFLCVILAAWLNDLPLRARVATLVCCLVCLLAISPVLYGFPMSTSYWDTLFKIFPSWK